MIQALFENTRPFNWQPVEHYGPEGSGDCSEWDDDDMRAAQEFLALASKPIIWERPSKSSLPLDGVKGDPDFVAATDEELLLIGQNIWLGFPDPPEFTIVKCNLVDRTTMRLGHFDNWPENWTRKED